MTYPKDLRFFVTTPPQCQLGVTTKRQDYLKIYIFMKCAPSKYSSLYKIFVRSWIFCSWFRSFFSFKTELLGFFTLKGPSIRRMSKHTTIGALAWSLILYRIALDRKATWLPLKLRKRSMYHILYLGLYWWIVLTNLRNWRCWVFPGSLYSGRNISWNFQMTPLLRLIV